MKKIIDSGFFDSENGDRTYDAEDMGRLFDGMITEGVYLGVGGQFRTFPGDTNDSIIVGSGRAWFSNRWVYSSTSVVLNVPKADLLSPRKDGVYLTVDKTDAARNSYIELLPGTPSQNPPLVKTFISSEGGMKKQYLIAIITRPAKSTTIRQGDIEYMVGRSDEVPFCAGILNPLNPQEYVNKFVQDSTDWLDRFIIQSEKNLQQNQKNFDDWFVKFKKDSENSMNDVLLWVGDKQTEIIEWQIEQKKEFNDWWDIIKETLNENAVGELKNEIDAVDKKLTDFIELTVNTFGDISDDILDLTRDLSSSGTLQKFSNQVDLDLLNTPGRYNFKNRSMANMLNIPANNILPNETKLRSRSFIVSVDRVNASTIDSTIVNLRQTLIFIESDNIEFEYTWSRTWNAATRKWAQWVRSDGLMDYYIVSNTDSFIRVDKYADGRMNMYGWYIKLCTFNEYYAGMYCDTSVPKVVYPEPFKKFDSVTKNAYRTEAPGALIPTCWSLPEDTNTYWSGGVGLARSTQSTNVRAKFVWSTQGWWK